MPHHSVRTLSAAFASVLVASFMGAAIIAAPAHAHTDLVGTAPADGDVLDGAPAAVTLTFNEELLEAAVRVSITDESGAVVAKDIAESAGSDVTVPWPADLAPGTYVVSYRVVSGDGHPVSGDITFTYGPAAAASSSPAAPAGSGSEAEAEATADEAVAVVVEEAPTEPVVIEGAATDTSSDSPVNAVIVGLVIAGALITALVVWNRRRA